MEMDVRGVKLPLESRKHGTKEPRRSPKGGSLLLRNGLTEGRIQESTEKYYLTEMGKALLNNK